MILCQYQQIRFPIRRRAYTVTNLYFSACYCHRAILSSLSVAYCWTKSFSKGYKIKINSWKEISNRNHFTIASINAVVRTCNLQLVDCHLHLYIFNMSGIFLMKCHWGPTMSVVICRPTMTGRVVRPQVNFFDMWQSACRTKRTFCRQIVTCRRS